MPVGEDWLSHFAEREPEPRQPLLQPDNDARMWPSVPSLPPPIRIKRPPGTWEELQSIAHEAADGLPRGSRAFIALGIVAVLALAVVATILLMRYSGGDSPDRAVASGGTAPTPTAPDRGSRYLPTPSPATPPAAPPLEDRAGVASPAPAASKPEPKPTPTPTPAARLKPTPERTPPASPTRTAPPPLSAVVGDATRVLPSPTASAAPTLPPPPVTAPTPAPASTPPPSPRVLGAPADTAATNAPVSTAPPDAAAVAKTAISSVLEGYRAGYSTLNSRAVQAVWPGVNERALARAFEQLDAQTMSFSSCGIEVKGQVAQAFCVGEVAFVTKVGSRTPRVEVRRWTFDLRRVGEAWQIERVATR